MHSEQKFKKRELFCLTLRQRHLPIIRNIKFWTVLKNLRDDKWSVILMLASYTFTIYIYQVISSKT